MSKRKSVRVYETDDLQGEGSFVKLSAVKVREVRKARKLAKDAEVDAFMEGLKMLKDHVLAWNWVDDNDEPLPLPKDQPDVLDELTNEEVEFLAGILMGVPKN